MSNDNLNNPDNIFLLGGSVEDGSLTTTEEDATAPARHLHAVNTETSEDPFAEVYAIPAVVDPANPRGTGLVARARVLAKRQLLHATQYTLEVKSSREGSFIDGAAERNYLLFLNILYGIGIVPADHPTMRNVPATDIFSGHMVDHSHRPLHDDQYLQEILDAAYAANFRSPRPAAIDRAIRVLARANKINVMRQKFVDRIPAWDGVERFRNYLYQYFAAGGECQKDNDLTRDVCAYFLQSVYYRVTEPGCYAPIVMTLISAQNAGKTGFWKSIASFVLDLPYRKAPEVVVDLAKDSNEILRGIIGVSPVAVISEQQGFGTAELNKIKSITATTSDTFHQKFERPQTMERSFVFGMDANNYSHFYRDETGNRRFFPVFLGRTADEDGKPAWRSQFQLDYRSFTADLFMQLMAEIRETTTLAAYEEEVDGLSRRVAEFSEKEVEHARDAAGMIEYESCMAEVLTEVPLYVSNAKAMLFICESDLDQALRRRVAPKRHSIKRLRKYLKSLRFEFMYQLNNTKEAKDANAGKVPSIPGFLVPDPSFVGVEDDFMQFVPEDRNNHVRMPCIRSKKAKDDGRF